MKVVIEYSLPDDAYDYYLARKGRDMHDVIRSLNDYLRGKIKYTDEVGSFEEVQEQWFELLKEFDLDPYEDT